MAARYSSLARRSEIGLRVRQQHRRTERPAVMSTRTGAARPRRTQIARRQTRERRSRHLTIARSTPCRRVSRPNALPVRSVGNGRSIDSTISPGASTVRPGPVKNSSNGIGRAAVGADQIQARAVRQQRRRGVGSRRRVAEIAGQRRAIADLHRSDDHRRFDERRKVLPQRS